MGIKEVSQEDFSKEVLESDVPVMVDFSAIWCGPCKAMEPTLEKIAEEANGKYKVLKVDIDDAPKLVEQYKIRSVPMILVFKNGAVAQSSVGKISRENLLKLFE